MKLVNTLNVLLTVHGFLHYVFLSLKGQFFFRKFSFSSAYMEMNFQDSNDIIMFMMKITCVHNNDISSEVCRVFA